jgi:uncharacterized membrane protein
MSMRRALFVVMCVGCVGVAGYGLSYFFGLPFRFVYRHFIEVRHLLYGHVFGGAVALLTGPWQFSTRLRALKPRVHRALGYMYVSAIVVGGVFGLVLATMSMGGLVAHLGFGTLAVAWLTTTAVAVQSARTGNFVKHQQWMVRSFALSLAAVTLRNWLPLLAMKLPFLTAYAIVSWLCWVPNLLVAEWMIASRAELRSVETPRAVGRESLPF